MLVQRVLTEDIVARRSSPTRRMERPLSRPFAVPGWRLRSNDLVDEVCLMTLPVILRTGRRLFGETTDKTTWKLTESKTVGEGIPITIFHRADR
jgi:hypothetical protein